MAGFLYGQTEYNILNNTIHLTDYVKAAAQAKMTYLSITDKSLHGYYKFITECQKYNIKPIIGLEVTVNREAYSDTFLVYALNNTGFKGLIRITSFIETNEEKKALAEIAKFQNDLAIILVVNRSFLTSFDASMGYEMLNKLNNYKHFYLGISFQDRSLVEVNEHYLRFANSVNIISLPLHQTLYLNNGDSKVYESLTLIGGAKKTIGEGMNYAFPYELEEEFKNHPELLANLDKLASTVDLRLYKDKVELPSYPNTKGKSSKEFLKDLCERGLKRRLYNHANDYETYHNRLTYELGVINRMGYDDYFLIVWDFILFAKQNDVLVGPGRGSAAGSLVAYCLGITEVDPIKYDLLFERFLNPERISMPDIDTDFPDDKRDLVIEHVRELYGSDHVCNISAFGTFLVKSSIRDLGRVLKFDSKRLDEIVDLAVNATDYDALLAQFIEREDIYNLLFIAKKLENLPKHISTHAAGIILSKDSLYNIIPVQNGINNLYQAQIEASDLEKIGLLKMDFLGIRNLSIVDNVLKEIKVLDQKGIRNIPLDDAKTYRLFQEADTTGVFQLESEGVRKVLVKLHPTNFEDIVSTLALYRPGPMENIDEFIERRHGKKYDIIHPDLLPILKSTYGIIVYQEQIMRIAQVFAGYSLGQADLLRRAMSKKDEATLNKERVNFVASATKKGYTEKIANEIYDYIVKFANYGFNRSHSVAYAMLCYQMGYLKANYFGSFMANIMNNVIGSTKALANYISYAKYHNVITDKPDINYSGLKFVSRNHRLLFPLVAIFSIGEIVAKQIIEERKNGLFTSLSDFTSRCTFVNNRLVEALIYSGAFDSFGKTRKNLFENSDSKTAIFDKHLDDIIETRDEYDEAYLREQELYYLGVNIQYNLFKNSAKYQKIYHATPVGYGKAGDFVRYIGLLGDYKSMVTKNDEYMAKGTCYDDGTSLPFVMFPKAFEVYNKLLNSKELVVLYGRLGVNDRNGKIQLILDKIELIEQK